MSYLYKEFKDPIIKNNSDIPNSGGIYCIFNKLNNKMYIGSSISLFKRLCTHKNSLKINKHYNSILQNSFNYYGEDNFAICILEQNIPENLLLTLEQYYIDLYNPEFNIWKTAHSTGGWKHSKEAIEKMKTYKRKVCSKETLKKRSIALKGRIFTKEHREKIKKALTGVPLTENHKRKLSLRAKSRGINHHTEIMQYTKENVFIKKFFSLADAEKETGILRTSIGNCASGRSHSAGGFIWKYKKEREGYLG